MSQHTLRKTSHLRINLENDVQSPHLTNGLERYHFIHQALPELDLAAVDTTWFLFQKKLAAPLLISAMTGGTEEGGTINMRLAEAAQARGIAMGLGSQRVALEQPQAAASFQVRAVAPDILLFANLGAAQLNYGYTAEQCQRAVDMVQADALVLHLNPLHEVLQHDGNWNWAGLLDKIGAVCRALAVPVIAKEVGWGISDQVARWLLEAGVAAIDVAGAGGTSWSEVEYYRAEDERGRHLAQVLADWGLPTALSLQLVRQVVGDEIPIFASGGIRTGIEVAKALALGAGLAGLAAPMLHAAVQGTEAVVAEIDRLVDELRAAMFAAGAGTLAELRRPGKLRRWDELWAEAETKSVRRL